MLDVKAPNRELLPAEQAVVQLLSDHWIGLTAEGGVVLEFIDAVKNNSELVRQLRDGWDGKLLVHIEGIQPVAERVIQNWLFECPDEIFYGERALSIDDLCKKISRRTKRDSFKIPRFRRVRRSAKGEQANDEFKIYRSTHGLRPQIRSELSETQVDANGSLIEQIRRERAAYTAEFYDSIDNQMTVCDLYLAKALDKHLTMNAEDPQNIVDFLEAFIVELANYAERNNAQQVRKADILSHMADWILNDGMRFTRSLVARGSNLAKRVRNSEMTYRSDEAAISLEDLKSVYVACLPETSLAGEAGAASSGDNSKDTDSDDEADVISGDSAQCLVALQTTGAQVLDGSEEAAKQGEVTGGGGELFEVPSAEGLSSKPGYIAEIDELLSTERPSVDFGDTLEEDSPEAKLAQFLKKKSELLAYLRNKPKQSNLTHSYFGYVLRTLESILENPREHSYSLPQVRVLIATMECYFKLYKVDVKKSARPEASKKGDRGALDITVEGLLPHVLKSIRETGPARTELKRSQTHLDLIDEEILSLLEFSQQTIAVLTDIERRLAVFGPELDRLTEEFGDLPRAEMLTAQLEVLRLDLEEVESAIEKFDALVLQKEELAREVGQVDMSAKDAFDRMVAIASKGREIQAQIDSAERNVDDFLRPRAEELNAESEALTAQIEGLEGESSRLLAQIEVLEGKVESLTDQQLALNEFKASLSERHENLVQGKAKIMLAIQSVHRAAEALLAGAIDLGPLKTLLSE